MEKYVINFNNSYASLPERFYERNMPASFADPTLLAFNYGLAGELGITTGNLSDNDLAGIFSGQKILPGSQPISQAYAGYQFGHPTPVLGDGRAHLLGETAGYDIQLKGSGRNSFSRGGDGRSALGPVIREYLVSEAMANLGVPTTRALAAVRTGEEVDRQDGPEPGGVFTRVAQSHVRVGTFQYFAFKNDFEAVEILLDYVVSRFYPELKDLPSPDKCMGFLRSLTQRQSELIASWLALGFIHGVMNTDNFSAVGITIDYGPCAFMDDFSYNKVFSSIDQGGRYSYENQIPIALWNIYRLAECFVPLLDSDEKRAVDMLTGALRDSPDYFKAARERKMAAKLGVTAADNSTEEIKSRSSANADEVSAASQVATLFLDYLEKEQLDFNLAFRYLPELYNGQTDFYPVSPDLEHFISRWKDLSPDIDNLNSVNPLYIPRNHQVERAIESSYAGDDSVFFEMLEVGKDPWTKNKDLHQYAGPPEAHEVVTRTFCGT